MKRTLVETQSFARDLRRLLKRRPDLGEHVQRTLARLADDAFDPRLRTHKLRGELAESWSCSVAYDLRILFQLAEHEGERLVLLETIGTHDEVY